MHFVKIEVEVEALEFLVVDAGVVPMVETLPRFSSLSAIRILKIKYERPIVPMVIPLVLQMVVPCGGKYESKEQISLQFGLCEASWLNRSCLMGTGLPPLGITWCSSITVSYTHLTLPTIYSV